jgi:RluA family pseudouridine synthase
MFPLQSMIPCLLHEDDHLLVVHKPPGWNTHAPSSTAGEGTYDWLRHREPRWAGLATIHRLDKETSGVIVFAKTALANRSLTDQFARHTARKRYLLLSDRPVPRKEFVAESWLVRVGERYVSRPQVAGGDRAETRFRVLERHPGRTLVEAMPITGRTHQIRVHAAEHGFPILGDTLYGGSPAARLCLRADSLTLKHPASGEAVTFQARSDFAADPRLELRAAIIDPRETTAFRLIHGASDGWPGWYVDRLGDWLLSQSEQPLTPAQTEQLRALLGSPRCRFGLGTGHVSGPHGGAAVPEELGRRDAGNGLSAFGNGGEHTPLACGIRRPAESFVPSMEVSGGPPDTARGPYALPAPNTDDAGPTLRGAYHKLLRRDVRRTVADEAAPQLVLLRSPQDTGQRPVASPSPLKGERAGVRGEKVEKRPISPADLQDDRPHLTLGG